MSRFSALVLSWWIVLATAASMARAAADVWDANGANPPNGIWGTANNWMDNTTPGNGDTATFNLANAYTATFNANPLAIQALTVSAGDVTFASSGGPRTLLVNSASGGQDATIDSGSILSLGTSGNPLHLTVGDDLSVQGLSVLNIRFGSDVQAADLTTGGLAGTIDVSGTGSSLTLTGSTQNIGRVGDGDLVIQSNADGSIAGTLNVSTTAGLTGSVSVLSDGNLALGGNLTIAAQNLVGQNGSVNINGSGSQLVQSGASTITVGSAANGTAAINIGTTTTNGTLTTGTGTLTINDTGTVTVGSGANIGTLNARGDVTINGGTLAVSGGSLFVGSSNFNLAAGKTMTIQNGGDANFTAGSFISYQIEDNTTYLVTGAGSTWTLGSFLEVDVNSTLTVEDGGQMSVNSLFAVGSDGTGTLTINGGGAVFSPGGIVGSLMGSNGAVTVNGAGSTWTNSSQLAIGFGGAGELTIEAGGSVSNTVAYIGDISGSTGTVTVTGDSSAWTNSSQLTVGNGGTGTLTIEAGGSVSSSFGYIGGDDGSTGIGTVTVTGAGSTWTNSFELVVANIADGTLMVEAGGSVSNTDGYIGFGSTGTVTVTGADSTWTNSGNLTVGSSGTGTLTMTNGGEVVVAGSLMANATSRVRLLGGKLTVNQFGAGGLNALDWQSGTLRLTAGSGLTVGAGGLFGPSLALDAGKNLEVDHTLTIASGAELFTSGLLSAGALVNNGDLILSSTTVSGPVTHAAGATITAIGGVTFNDLVSGPGGFYGPGTITFAGGMSPGASPAEVSFEGGIALADTNTLFIEIGGATPGSQYDRLSIAGSASLDGILDVSLINEFMPSGGQQFTILTAGSIVNNGFVLTGSAASSFNLLISSTSVILRTIGLAGDYNGNGTVDAADYTVWRDNLGGTSLPNESASLGTVDDLDYDFWKLHFGETAGSGSGANSLPAAGSASEFAVVPEPPSAVVLFFNLAMLGIHRIVATSRENPRQHRGSSQELSSASAPQGI